MFINASIGIGQTTVDPRLPGPGKAPFAHS